MPVCFDAWGFKDLAKSCKLCLTLFLKKKFCYFFFFSSLHIVVMLTRLH